MECLKGSILGLIFFNIFLCDMFFMVDNIDIASYANDNIPYCVGKSQCDLETKGSSQTFQMVS